MSRPLLLEDTVEVAALRHRLALGLNWIDALTGQPVAARLRSELEAIGPLPDRTAFERHGNGRHALRYAGAVSRKLDKTVADALDRRWTVRTFGLPFPALPAASGPGYALALDPRVAVPRRLRFELVFQGDEPAASPLNIRTPWIWPGPAYPFPATANLIRGRVLRGPSLPLAAPLRWARLFATTPHGETDFAAATVVGVGHGDERGEYALALQSRAVAGAQLSNPVRVRLWAFAPPAGAAPGDDPLADLPLEDAGADAINDVLRGISVPAAYTATQSRSVTLRLGETKNDADTVFLFA